MNTQAHTSPPASLEDFISIANDAPVLMWMAAPNKKCVWFNKMWLDFRGKTLEEECGEEWKLGVHPEDLAYCVDQYNYYFDQRQPYRIEYRLQRHDGEYRWLLDTGKPRFDKEGKFLGYIGSCIDITERREIEQKINESNVRKRRILETITDAFFSVDSNWVFTYINQAGEELVHLSREEMIGKNCWQVFPELMQTQLYPKAYEAQRTKQLIQYETFYEPYQKWLYIRIHPSEEGTSVFIENITEWKKAKEELHLSQERLQSFFQSSVIGFLFGNIETSHIVQANDAFLQMIGYTREDLQNGLISRSKITPSEYWELDAQKTKEALENDACVPYEKEYVRKDGSRIPVMVGYSLIGGDKKEVVSFVLDLTERKKLERQKDEFISIASHELKTPVTTIKAFAQLLERHFEFTHEEKAAHHLHKMMLQIGKLTQLIEDLLDVSKIQAGKLKLNMEVFPCEEIIRESIEEVQAISPTHTLILEENCSECIQADRYRLGQVLTNLLTNAVKYSPQADKVIIRLKNVGDRLQLSIQDFGIGIPVEKQEQIFQRFYRIDDKTRQSFPGLGLGLYISSEIVKRHGGQIWVKSSEGSGSTFHFSLPLVACTTT